MNRSLVGAIRWVAAALVTLAPGFSPALVPEPSSDAQPRRALAAPARAVAIGERLAVDEQTMVGSAARSFLSSHPGDWRFDVDRKTGRALKVQGSGVPIFPGRGNSLGPDPSLDLDSDGLSIAKRLEPRVRAFLLENSGLVLPARGSIELDEARSLTRGRGRHVTLRFRWRIDGVPVEDAAVYVRINSGNVVQFGAHLVGESVVDTVPRISANAALARLLEATGDGELARFEAEPARVIVPMAVEDRIVHRLAWRFRYSVPGSVETWEARVDAHTGEIFELYDANHYARAVGGLFARTPFNENEIVVPLPLLELSIDGSPLTSGIDGAFPWSGGQIESGLGGRYFDTECSGCGSPAQPIARSSIGTGRLDFGLGGIDEQGNGISTRADRNSFYHLNQARRLALKWLPGLPWLATESFASVVNLPLTCNAVYTGSSVRFYRSGNGCNNTGEIADVVYHEWGHGLDIETAGGDMGEGTADMMAVHLSHRQDVGPGFRTNGSPVRNVDSAANGSIGVVTFTNYVARCGGAVHCYGQIFGQTGWDLSEALRARYGDNTGWRESERLYFVSIADAGGTHSASSQPIYDAYLAADDDDGNLANGTPHATEIYQSFNAHGIAGDPLPATAPCSRPEEPAAMLNVSCDRFELTWSPVADAAGYEVQRAELRADSPFYPIATLGAGELQYVDLDVAQGLDYRYVVMAVDASGCESTINSAMQARLPAKSALEIRTATTDDTPRGNRSGFADPVEEIDLSIELTNHGEIDASGIFGTIVPVTPGVTMLESTASWPVTAPGVVSATPDVLRFRADTAVCGDLLRFRLDLLDESGCASEPNWFDVRLGEPDGSGGFVCDSTPACYVPPSFAGLANAVPGPSCGEVTLNWAAADSSCENSIVRFEIHRAATPGFAPGPANRIASGLVATSFTDTLLVPGAIYHYVVRAIDSRSGAETNLVERVSVAATGPDIRGPVFAGLSSAESGPGCGEVALDWSQALESCSGPVAYEVHRSNDAGFVPSAATLVASTFSTGFVDVARPPGEDATYVVRARDAAGNETTSDTRVTARSGIVDRILATADFETLAGWQVGALNDATAGNWERADPEPTAFQPGDDHTPAGSSCWITGPLAGSGNGSHDVDSGTTTLLSPPYDLSGTTAPAVRYWRWFTNDRGASPGGDPFVVEITADDGANWALVEQVGAGTPLAWVPVEVPLASLVPSDATVRFRFTARDADPGSLVEAAIDDLSIADIELGCLDCPALVPAIGIIRVNRSGDAVILDWTADPNPGSSFVVYRLSGPAFTDRLRIGTTATRTFTHEAAALAAEDFYYLVTAVDACGTESD